MHNDDDDDGGGECTEIFKLDCKCIYTKRNTDTLQTHFTSGDIESVLLYELLDWFFVNNHLSRFVLFSKFLSLFSFSVYVLRFGVRVCRFKSVLVTHLQHLSHRFRTFVN